MSRRLTALSAKEMIAHGIDPAEERNYIATLVAAISATGGYEDRKSLIAWGINPKSDRSLLWLPGYGAPLFQFEFPDSGKPYIHSLVAEINRQLKALENAYAAADWWLLEHAELDHSAAPVSLLRRNNALLRALAGKVYAAA